MIHINEDIQDIKVGLGQISKVIIDGVEVWTKINPVFSAQFRMDSITDRFKSKGFRSGDAQYSSDGGNWIDASGDVDVTGSLDWYVRAKPGGAPLTKMNFFEADIAEVVSIDTSGITNLESLFYGCSKLVVAPMIDFTAATEASFMFMNCTALTTVPAYDYSTIENMSDIFKSCSSLQSLPVINCSACKYVRNMFDGCTSLVCISGVDTTGVQGTGTANMFDNTPALVNPTASEKTQILAKTNYINANPCP